MATVDELKILIKAETKDLRKKLDHTNKQLDKTSKQSKKTAQNITASFKKAAIGVAAFAAVAVKLGSVIAKVGSEFEDLKDSLDVVFGSMKAGDAAMKRVFDFAATTPFQVETATKAFIALKSVGIEPTNKMLQTFADTASVSVDQLGVFEALVRTVQRSAAGGLGLEELNMLSDRGIPALKILSEELGLTKDDIAKFGKTVEGAKLITDALQEGLNKRFGGAMESKMDNLSTKTSNMTIAFKQLADEVFQSGLGDFFGNMADSFRETAESIVRASQAARGVGTGVQELLPQFGDRMTDVQKLQEEKDTLKANLELLRAAKDPLVARAMGDKNKRTGISGAVDGIVQAAGGAPTGPLSTEEIGRMDTIIERMRVLQAEYDKLILFKGKLSDTEKDDLMRQGELQNSLGFITGLIQKSKGDTEQLAFATANLSEIYADNEEKLLALGVKEKDIIALLKEHTEATKKVSTFTDEMKQSIISSSQAFTSDFVNALLDGENALESFKNFAKNIVSQIISTFLQMAVVNQILNSVFNLTGTPDALPTIKLAGGGAVQKGAPALVGERGPEIFVPNTGGTIMNNMNSKNAMGGGSPIIVNQSVNFATGVVPTVRAEVQKMLPQISDVTKGAVLEAAVRGGSFRKGLLGSG